MRIGELSRRAGIAPSAIRYYERIGLLPESARISDKRDFDPDILGRLALIAHGRACGIRLEEMKHVLAAGEGKNPRDLWRPLVASKLEELDELEAQLAARRASLKAIRRCRCLSIEACAGLLSKRRRVPRSAREVPPLRSGRHRKSLAGE